MGAIESKQSRVPPVTLVMVRPEGAKAEASAIAIVGNFRLQRIEQFLDLKDLEGVIYLQLFKRNLEKCKTNSCFDKFKEAFFKLEIADI